MASLEDMSRRTEGGTISRSHSDLVRATVGAVESLKQRSHQIAKGQIILA